jgi:hypothetical protein
MTQTLTALLALVVAGVGGYGCQTPQTEPNSWLPPLGAPVLILPVIAGKPALDAEARAMTACLHKELTATLDCPTVVAGDLPDLRPMLTHANLIRDGRLALDEVAALAQAAGCGAAVALELSTVEPYAPQSMTGTVTVVEAHTGAALQAFHLMLDLGRPESVDRYKDYLRRVRAFRTANLESREEDRVHTALLCPQLFKEFAANCIATRIATGTHSASRDTCRR